MPNTILPLATLCLCNATCGGSLVGCSPEEDPHRLLLIARPSPACRSVPASAQGRRPREHRRTATTTHARPHASSHPPCVAVEHPPHHHANAERRRRDLQRVDFGDHPTRAGPPFSAAGPGCRSRTAPPKVGTRVASAGGLPVEPHGAWLAGPTPGLRGGWS